MGGAGLDVLEVEPPTEGSLALRMHPQVVMTPHQGASTVDAQLRVAHDVARNMSDIFDGGAYVGVVNAPDLSSVRRAGPEMEKFLELSECFGAFLSQRFVERKLMGVTITMEGRLGTDNDDDMSSYDMIYASEPPLLALVLTPIPRWCMAVPQPQPLPLPLPLPLLPKQARL